MPTFNGYVKEFPNIRIDHFRRLLDKPRPVVGLLSHVHSDHLQGLESWGKIPLYCSIATRELLLRVEKYPHRLNFAKGILESRKQHYKGLKNVLKPLPLNTPTEIEVDLQRFIQVTLLDANHCIGAVMFLIEDAQKAILYTGDIRSETWWVNSLARNPVAIPYTFGTKRLDQIYLDTTFATKEKRYQKFKSKAAGIQELLEKVSKFPQDTTFHFHAWTFGYEDVWIALSSAFKTQVHVDDYKRRLYNPFTPENSAVSQHHEFSALSGFRTGNRFQKGCLTGEASVKLHSCELGTGCLASSSPSTVSIVPVTNRGEDGDILPERGAGGRGGDLLRNHGYLELDDQNLTRMLIELCDERAEDPRIRSEVRNIIIKALESEDKAIRLDSTVGLWEPHSDINLNDFVKHLIQLASSCHRGEQQNIGNTVTQAIIQDVELSSRIQFSYARHSSYEELCELVATFRPQDIYPCTTNWREWTLDESIESLFGHLCSGTVFAHDQEMLCFESQRKVSRELKRPHSPPESQPSDNSRSRSPVLSQEIDSSVRKLSFQSQQNILDLVDGKASHYPKRRLLKSERAFERPLQATQELSEFTTSTRDSDTCGLQPTIKTNKVVFSKLHLEDGDLQELALYRSASARKEVSGTQTNPIEISDGLPLTLKSRRPSDTLLEGLPHYENAIWTNTSEHEGLESDLSLSDTAFESQLSTSILPKRKAQIGRRKHAYKAARDLCGAWADSYSLISSSADHGSEEVEL